MSELAGLVAGNSTVRIDLDRWAEVRAMAPVDIPYHEEGLACASYGSGWSVHRVTCPYPMPQRIGNWRVAYSEGVLVVTEDACIWGMADRYAFTLNSIGSLQVEILNRHGVATPHRIAAAARIASWILGLAP